MNLIDFTFKDDVGNFVNKWETIDDNGQRSWRVYCMGRAIDIEITVADVR